MTSSVTPPSEHAVQAYEVAVGVLRLVDGLVGGSNSNDTATHADATAAASLALRASLATLLVLTCPGGERGYYTAAATEIYEDMFAEGHGVAEALGAFLSHGWRHTDGVQLDHEVYVESGSVAGGSYLARSACACGYYGPDHVVPSRSSRSVREALMEAREDAIAHAQWSIIKPVMAVPTG